MSKPVCKNNLSLLASLPSPARSPQPRGNRPAKQSLECQPLALPQSWKSSSPIQGQHCSKTDGISFASQAPAAITSQAPPMQIRSRNNGVLACALGLWATSENLVQMHAALSAWWECIFGHDETNAICRTDHGGILESVNVLELACYRALAQKVADRLAADKCQAMVSVVWHCWLTTITTAARQETETSAEELACYDIIVEAVVERLVSNRCEELIAVAWRAWSTIFLAAASPIGSIASAGSDTSAQCCVGFMSEIEFEGLNKEWVARSRSRSRSVLLSFVAKQSMAEDNTLLMCKVMRAWADTTAAAHALAERAAWFESNARRDAQLIALAMCLAARRTTEDFHCCFTAWNKETAEQRLLVAEETLQDLLASSDALHRLALPPGILQQFDGGSGAVATGVA